MIDILIYIVFGYLFIGFANFAFCKTAESWYDKLFNWPSYFNYWKDRLFDK